MPRALQPETQGKGECECMSGCERERERVADAAAVDDDGGGGSDDGCENDGVGKVIHTA